MRVRGAGLHLGAASHSERFTFWQVISLSLGVTGGTLSGAGLAEGRPMQGALGSRGARWMAMILIVEDDVFIREIAELVIQDWGYEVISASDVEEALVILRSPQPIDALFTDIYLKRAVQGGCDLAREAIRLRPGLRVLYTTGNAITDAMKALFVEGTTCLRKPYGDQQLKASIEHMLAA